MSESTSVLEVHPLLGIGLTVGAYVIATKAWRTFGGPAVLHPVLLATTLVSVVVIVTDMRYETYLAQNALVNEALALVIVALAVPLYRQFGLIRQAGHSLAPALVVGSVVAIVTALAFPLLDGATDQLVATLAPKSTTAAVAVEISERFGGTASLTAVVVIATGIFGAVFGPALFKATDIEDGRAMGFALGVASHAIGTARAFQISDVAGAFASLGMILNALLTIALVPVALSLLVA